MSRFIKIGKSNFNKYNIDFYSYEYRTREIHKSKTNGISMSREYHYIVFKLNIKGIEHTETIDLNSAEEFNQVVNYIELGLNK